MSDPTSIQTVFDRARRYQELSQKLLRATENEPTLLPECPPYETQYGAAHVFAQSSELADIAAFYRACGLGHPQKERLDHVAVELEFMSFLAVKEAYAIHNGEEEHSSQMRDLQKKFLADHLARWVPAFAARFEARAPDLAHTLREWLNSEIRRFGIEAIPIRTVDLRPAGSVEESFECGDGTCALA